MSNHTTRGAVSAAAPHWTSKDIQAHLEDEGDLEMPEEQNNRIHLSNAIIKLIPEKRELHYMYEDNDLEGREDAEESFVRLDEREPGQHVLIDTGDYFVPPCSADFDAPDARDHYNCETYDAEYYLYLVPASVWEQCKDEVLKANREYRDLMNQCQRQ